MGINPALLSVVAAYCTFLLVCCACVVFYLVMLHCVVICLQFISVAWPY